MGRWEFNEVDPSNVRVDVTQRDQFNNDDVGLAEALVRESIQNSSDAPAGHDAVKVRFSLRAVSGKEAQNFSARLSALRPHLKACGVDDGPLDEPSFRVLAIEDFNTRGLTGSFEEVDKGNFDSFWRAVGESGKTGKAGGRWGLGKLVYSSSSALKVFFGLTVSSEHPRPALMGQVVLKNHRIGNTFHPAHGFWFEKRSGHLRLQYPVEDSAEIDLFRELGALERVNQAGLSIIIPYLQDEIDEEAIISGVINNYYFPILAGRLVVEVGSLTINKNTFLEIAERHNAGQHVPFDFVKGISDSINVVPEVSASKPIGNADLDASFFSAEQLALMKERFAMGEIVRVRVPVTLKPRGQPDTVSFIDLYLKSLPDGQRPFALVARGPITLPGERKHFASAAAYGALIANDPGVAGFLGDAENPAHTAWNLKAEKLAPGWRSPQGTLSSIRHSLRQLYGMIAEQAEREDSEALIDFFSIFEKSQANQGKRKKTPKPFIDIPSREKAISIRAHKGGFDVVAGPAAKNWAYPRTIRVRVAYDMIGANPFNRHSPFDFDLTKSDEIDVESTEASCEAIKSNILKVTAESASFQISVRGFDPRRDIVVDARAA
jgi:hypothetical protein